MQTIPHVLASLALLAAPAGAAPVPSQPLPEQPVLSQRVVAQPVVAQPVRPLPAPAQPAPTPIGTLKVIATLPTYGDLAKEVGGDLVDVTVVCRPTQDMHLVGITPSVMARVQHADLVLYTGLDAEAWLDPLLRGSGNLGLLPGSPGAVAMSDGIPVKEVPSVLSRAEGDIHAYGNPHVWTDPLAVRTMAATVRDAFSRALPAHAAEFEVRCKDFTDRMTRALIGWLTQYSRLKGRKVVTFHQSWPYFLERFGIELAGTIESKPRVAPTASHLNELIESMKAQHVKVIIREPFQDPEATEFVARATGATVLELQAHPDGTPETQGIIAHFEHNLAAIAAALDAAEGTAP